MEPIEITAKTVEEARQMAAQELGVPVEQVGHEILEEGGKGFLGLGGGRVKIRAWSLGESAQLEGETRAQVPSLAEESQVRALANSLVDMLRTVLAAMQVDVRPELREATPEEVQVDLVGPEAGLLIGRQGHTLDALQYLVGIAVNRLHRTRVRVILDAEGYRDRHRAMLENRARELAEQVKATGQEAVLDPLPARDRRTIHTYLANDPDVTTYSEGEGEDRRLVITPRK